MNWLYPSLFWALLALSIPILIHLLNFRKYKLIYFSNVRFLENLVVETKSTERLKKWLVLISRLLAFLFLILAFIQPFIPAKENNTLKNGKRAISIFIDNSFSMNGINKNGHLLDEALRKAKSIIESFETGDDYYVLTQDFIGKHLQAYSKSEAIELLKEIQLSSGSKPLHQVINKQKEQVYSSATVSKLAFCISDFQANSIDFSQLKDDSTVNVTFIPLRANKQNNLYIDSVYTKFPATQLNRPQTLMARIMNISDQDIEDKILRLNVNSKERAPVTFSVKANTSETIEIPFVWQERKEINGKISLDDDQITFDDDLYFSISPVSSVKVLVIKGSGASKTYIENLYSSDSLFDIQVMNESAIDFTSFKQSNTIVLDHLVQFSSGLTLELKKFIESGGHVWYIPSLESDIKANNTAMQSIGASGFALIDTNRSKVLNINQAHPLFSGVFDKLKENIDVPTINRFFIGLSNVSAPRQSLLVCTNGLPLLDEYSIGKGHFYVLHTTLNDEASNLGKHALIVPLGINIAINSLKGIPLFYFNGSNNKVPIRYQVSNSESPVQMKSLDAKTSLIPEVKQVDQNYYLYTTNQPSTAGNYQLIKDNVAFQSVSFNYSRKESNIVNYSTEALQEKLDQNQLLHYSIIDKTEVALQEALFGLHKGKSLWMYFLMTAIGFFIMEMILLKLFKS
jgi:hypothetical protein